MYEIPRRLLGVAVFHVADVADANRRSVGVGDDDAVEIIGILHTRKRAHAQFPIAAANRSSRHFHVFVLNRVLKLPDGQPVGIEFFGVGKHANLPQAAAR